MALTKGQLDFRDTKGFSVEDTFTNLKNNYFQPIIEEEKKLIEEYHKGLFGTLGCGGATALGCITPFIAIGIVSLILLKILPQNTNGSIIFNTTIWTLLITIPEYFFIVWWNNTDFEETHCKSTPYNIRVIKDLLLPLTAIVSQDMKDEANISLTTSLIPLNNSKNKLTNSQIREMGKQLKSGQSVYDNDILDLSAVMADGTKVNFNLNQILSEVYVYKKRGSKHKVKGKNTLKAVFVVPTKTYKPIRQGDLNFDGFLANVVLSDKNQKIVVKEVEEISSPTIDPTQIREKFVDMMTSVYSLLEAN